MTEKQKVYTAFCFFCAYAFDMKRNYTIKIDLRRPTIGKIPGIVNGDTANTFTFLLTDNGKPVALDPDLNKLIAVFNRSDGKVYTQDADTGLSIDDASAGKIVLDVYASSFTAGKNTVELQVYERENSSATTYPDLVTTATIEFTARAATLTDEGETAPSQLPMLEQLIADATAAAAAANAAAAAAAAAAVAAQNAGNFVINVVNPYWNGNEFEGYADKTNDEIISAMESGRIIVVRVAGTDDETVYTMIEAYSLPDAHETVCESNHASCTVLVGGVDTQISGIVYQFLLM